MPDLTTDLLLSVAVFAGAFVWGLSGFVFSAVAGAIPTIWCDMRGMPKSEQRGLVQPFIAAMQLFAIVLLVGHQDLSSKVLIDLAISLPALFAGPALGVIAFHRVNETVFRKTVLVLLLLSGASLILTH